MLRFGASTFHGPRDHLRENFRTDQENVPRLPCSQANVERTGLSSFYDSLPHSQDSFEAALQMAREASQSAGQPGISRKQWSSRLCNKATIKAVMTTVQPYAITGRTESFYQSTYLPRQSFVQITYGLQRQWRRASCKLAVPLLEQRILNEPSSPPLENHNKYEQQPGGPTFGSCDFPYPCGEVLKGGDGEGGCGVVNQPRTANNYMAAQIEGSAEPAKDLLLEVYMWLRTEAEVEAGEVEVVEPEPLGAGEALAKALNPTPVTRVMVPAAVAAAVGTDLRLQSGRTARTFSEVPVPASGPAEHSAGLKDPAGDKAALTRDASAKLPRGLLQNLLLDHRHRQQQQQYPWLLPESETDPSGAWSLVDWPIGCDQSRRCAIPRPVPFGCPSVRRLSPGRFTVPESWLLGLAPRFPDGASRDCSHGGASGVKGAAENTQGAAAAVNGKERGQQDFNGQGLVGLGRVVPPTAVRCPVAWDALMASETAATMEALIELGCSLGTAVEPCEWAGKFMAEPSSLPPHLQTLGECRQGTAGEGASSARHVLLLSQQEQQHLQQLAACPAPWTTSGAAAALQRVLQLKPEPVLPLPQSSLPRHQPRLGGEGVSRLFSDDSRQGASGHHQRNSLLVSQLLGDAWRVIQADPASKIAAAAASSAAPGARLTRIQGDPLLAGPLCHSALMAAAVRATAAARAAPRRGVAAAGNEPGGKAAGDSRACGSTAEGAADGSGVGDDAVWGLRSPGRGGGRKVTSPPPPELLLLELPIQMTYDSALIVSAIMPSLSEGVNTGSTPTWRMLAAAAPSPPPLPMPAAAVRPTASLQIGVRGTGEITGAFTGGTKGRGIGQILRRQPACVEDLIAADLQLTDEGITDVRGEGGNSVDVRTLPVMLLPNYSKDGAGWIAGAGSSGDGDGDTLSFAESAPNALRSALADLGCTTAATAHLDLYFDWSVLGPARRGGAISMIGSRYAGHGIGVGSTGVGAAAKLLRTYLSPSPIVLTSESICRNRNGAAVQAVAMAAELGAQPQQRLSVLGRPSVALLLGRWQAQYAGSLIHLADYALWPGAKALQALQSWHHGTLVVSIDQIHGVKLARGGAGGGYGVAKGEACSSWAGKGDGVRPCAGNANTGGGDSSESGGRLEKSDAAIGEGRDAAPAAANASPTWCDAVAPKSGLTAITANGSCRTKQGMSTDSGTTALRGKRCLSEVNYWDMERGQEEDIGHKSGQAALAGGGSSSNNGDGAVQIVSVAARSVLDQTLPKRRRTDGISTSLVRAAASAFEAGTSSAAAACAASSGAETAAQPKTLHSKAVLESDKTTTGSLMLQVGAALAPTASRPASVVQIRGGSTNALARLQQLQLQGASDLQFFMQLQQTSHKCRSDAVLTPQLPLSLSAAPGKVPPPPPAPGSQKHTITLQLNEQHIELLAKLRDAHEVLVAKATAALKAAVEAGTEGNGCVAGIRDGKAVAEADVEVQVLQSGLWAAESMERVIASYKAHHRSMQMHVQQRRQPSTAGRPMAIAPERRVQLEMYVAVMGLRQSAVALLHYGVRAAHLALGQLAQQLPGLVNLCGGAVEVLEAASRQVEEQLAGLGSATTTIASASATAAGEAAFASDTNAAATADTAHRPRGPLVDHPALNAVHRLLTVLDTVTPDPRVLVVTDPRVFFALYPAVQAAGLRAAHLPAATVKALLAAPQLAACSKAGLTGASTSAVTATTAGNGSSGSGSEARTDTDACVELVQEVKKIAQRGTCLFVGHQMAASSAAFPLHHFDALLILAPDQHTAWDSGSGGSGGSITPCEDWSTVPQRLRECTVERHLFLTRRPHNSFLSNAARTRGYLEAADHTEQRTLQPATAPFGPASRQPPQEPMCNHHPQEHQQPLQPKRESSQTQRGSLQVLERNSDDAHVSNENPSACSLHAADEEQPKADDFRRTLSGATASACLPQHCCPQQQQPVPQAAQPHNGSLAGEQLIQQQPRPSQQQRQQQQQGGSASGLAVQQQQPLPSLRRVEQVAGEQRLHPRQDPQVLIPNSVAGASAHASMPAAGSDVALHHSGCNDGAFGLASPAGIVHACDSRGPGASSSSGSSGGRWPLIFSSAPGSVLRMRPSLSDGLLRRCEVTYGAEVWWRVLDIADIVLSPVACAAVWPFRPPLPLPQPPRAKQLSSSQRPSNMVNMSEQEEQSFVDMLLPVMLERVILLSMRYSRATVVFEAPAGLGTALLKRSAPLQAAAITAGLRLTLLTTVGPQATQHKLFSVVDAALQYDSSCCFTISSSGNSGDSWLPYAPLDERPSAAEVFLCTTPCLNPLSAVSLLGTGVTVRHLVPAIIATATALELEAENDSVMVSLFADGGQLGSTTDGTAATRIESGTGGERGMKSGARGTVHRACVDEKVLKLAKKHLQYIPPRSVSLLAAHLAAAMRETPQGKEQKQQELSEQLIVEEVHFQQRQQQQQQEEDGWRHEEQSQQQQQRQRDIKKHSETADGRHGSTVRQDMMQGLRSHQDLQRPQHHHGPAGRSSGTLLQKRTLQEMEHIQDQTAPKRQQRVGPSSPGGTTAGEAEDSARFQRGRPPDPDRGGWTGMQQPELPLYGRQQQQQRQNFHQKQSFQQHLEQRLQEPHERHEAQQPQQQNVSGHVENGAGSENHRGAQTPPSSNLADDIDSELLDLELGPDLDLGIGLQDEMDGFGAYRYNSRAQDAVADGLVDGRGPSCPHPTLSFDNPRGNGLRANSRHVLGAAVLGAARPGSHYFGAAPDAAALELSVEDEYEEAALRHRGVTMLRNPLSYTSTGAAPTRIGFGTRVGNSGLQLAPCALDPDPGLDPDLVDINLNEDRGFHEDRKGDGRTGLGTFQVPGKVCTSQGPAGPERWTPSAQTHQQSASGNLEPALVLPVDRASLDMDCILDEFLAQRFGTSGTPEPRAAISNTTDGRQWSRAASANEAAAALVIGSPFAAFAISSSSHGGANAVPSHEKPLNGNGDSAASQGRAAGLWQSGPPLPGRPGVALPGGRRGGRGFWVARSSDGTGRGRRSNRR